MGIIVDKPEFIAEYLLINQEIKAFKDTYLKPLEKRLEELKPLVREHIKEVYYPEIYYKKPKKKLTFDPIKLHAFLVDCPRVPKGWLASVTQDSFDLSQIDELYIRQYLSEEDIPESCYAEGEGNGSIEIPLNRKRVKAEQPSDINQVTPTVQGEGIST
jgi:hypothetical protein